MPPLTIACPSCGTKQKLGPETLGQKVQCPCGMSFSASPVFAVSSGSDWPPAWLTGRGSRLFAAAILVGALSGTAAWLVTRPHAANPPTTPPGPVAESPTDPKADTPPDQPSFADSPMPEPKVEPKTEPKTEPKVEPKTEPKTEPKVIPRVEPKVEPKTAPKAEPKVEPKTAPPAKVPQDPKPTPAAAAKVPPLPQPALPPVKGVTVFDAFDLPTIEIRRKYVIGKPLDVTVQGKLMKDAQGKPYFGGVVVPKLKVTPEQLARLSPQKRKWEQEGYPPSVYCYFSTDVAAAFEALPADREVTVRGIFQGRRDERDAYMGYVVVLTDCQPVPR